MRGWVSVRTAISALLALMGVSGVPDDLVKWSEWLTAAEPYVDRPWVKLLLVVAAVGLIFWPQLLQRLGLSSRPSPAPVPDMPIRAAVEYLRAQLSRDTANDEEELRLYFTSAREIERAAREGRVTIWGREIGGSRYEPAPAEYWRTAQFDRHDLLNPAGPNVRTEGNGNAIGVQVTPYEDVLLSRAQVEATWRRYWRRPAVVASAVIAAGVALVASCALLTSPPVPRDTPGKAKKSDAELKSDCVTTTTAALSYFESHPSRGPGDFDLRDPMRGLEQSRAWNARIDAGYRRDYAARVRNIILTLRERGILTDGDVRDLEFNLGGPTVWPRAVDMLTEIQAACLRLGD